MYNAFHIFRKNLLYIATSEKLIYIHFLNAYCRAVVIKFGVIRLVVRTQERHTLGGSGGMLPHENLEN